MTNKYQNSVVELNYKVFGDIGEDVIILHGLLGSLDNWQTIARQLSETYRVWIIDHRNHGRSPHSEEMSYAIMADDLKNFMDQQGLTHAHIVGHSMGGKVAMTFALTYPELTDQLVIVDIGPKPYEGDHIPILEAMLDIRPELYSERKDVEEIFSEKIHSQKIVQLMMKNLGRDPDGFFWKPNVKVLYKVYRDLMDSPLLEKSFAGKTSFIKGENSDYIDVEDLDTYRKYFPQAQLYVVPDAGHWVHSEQPEYFFQLLIKILGE